MASDKSWFHQVWRRFQYISIGKPSARQGVTRWRIKDAVRTRSERLIAWLKNCPCQHYGRKARIPELFQRRDLTLLALYNARLRFKTPPPTHSHNLLDAAAKLGSLEARLGYTFKNRMTGIEALKVTGDVHSLYYDGVVYETGKNKRLALLGDRVLSLALCEVWFQTDHSNRDHAEMSSQTVSRAALAVTGRILGLHLSILTKDGGSVSKDHIAETFEAVLGAVYVDSGYDMKVVKGVIRRHKIDNHPYLKKRKELGASEATRVAAACVTANIDQRATATRIVEKTVNEKAAMSVIPMNSVNQKPETLPGKQSTISKGGQSELGGPEGIDLKNTQKPETLPGEQSTISKGGQSELGGPGGIDLKNTQIRYKLSRRRSRTAILKRWIREKSDSERSRRALRALHRYRQLLEQGQRANAMAVFDEVVNNPARSSHVAESGKDTSELHENRLEKAEEKSLNLGERENSGGAAEFKQDANDSPEQRPREAEDKTVNAEAMEKSTGVFSVPKASSFDLAFEHEDRQVQIGAETHRNDVGVVQESQHTVAKEDNAEEACAASFTPYERPSTRTSHIRSTTIEPSIEELEQTTVALHMDAWSSRDSDVNTKSFAFAGSVSNRPFLESDMDRFFCDLLRIEYSKVHYRVDGDSCLRFRKTLGPDVRTGTKLLRIASKLQCALVEETAHVATIKHIVRRRIRMAASSNTIAEVSQNAPVHHLRTVGTLRHHAKVMFSEVLNAAMDDGLRFGGTAWDIFVRDHLERGEKDVLATTMQLAAARVRRMNLLLAAKERGHDQQPTLSPRRRNDGDGATYPTNAELMDISHGISQPDASDDKAVDSSSSITAPPTIAYVPRRTLDAVRLPRAHSTQSNVRRSTQSNVRRLTQSNVRPSWKQAKVEWKPPNLSRAARTSRTPSGLVDAIRVPEIHTKPSVSEPPKEGAATLRLVKYGTVRRTRYKHRA